MRRTTYAIGLLAAMALIGVVLLWPKAEGPQPPQSAVSAPLAGDERPLRPVGPGEGIPAPSFDIVRIEPTGTGAASGRAAAESRILLKADGGTVARAEADSRGEWALLITAPLAPGDHALSLLAALPDGRGIASRETVIVSLQEQHTERPLIVLMDPDQASEVMQLPGGPSARALSVDAADQTAQGTLRIGGRAEPGTALNVYLDDRYVSGTVADGEGRWSVEAKSGPRAGHHRIRLDALTADEFGAKRVGARLEVPFDNPAPAKGEGEPRLKVEAAAESWRIDGESGSTTIIYGPRAGRALDPAIAYPGQVTAPPPAAAVTAIPAADR